MAVANPSEPRRTFPPKGLRCSTEDWYLVTTFRSVSDFSAQSRKQRIKYEEMQAKMRETCSELPPLQRSEIRAGNDYILFDEENEVWARYSFAFIASNGFVRYRNVDTGSCHTGYLNGDLAGKVKELADAFRNIKHCYWMSLDVESTSNKAFEALINSRSDRRVHLSVVERKTNGQYRMHLLDALPEIPGGAAVVPAPGAGDDIVENADRNGFEVPFGRAVLPNGADATTARGCNEAAAEGRLGSNFPRSNLVGRTPNTMSLLSTPVDNVSLASGELEQVDEDETGGWGEADLNNTTDEFHTPPERTTCEAERGQNPDASPFRVGIIPNALIRASGASAADTPSISPQTASRFAAAGFPTDQIRTPGFPYADPYFTPLSTPANPTRPLGIPANQVGVTHIPIPANQMSATGVSANPVAHVTPFPANSIAASADLPANPGSSRGSGQRRPRSRLGKGDENNPAISANQNESENNSISASQSDVSTSFDPQLSSKSAPILNQATARPDFPRCQSVPFVKGEIIFGGGAFDTMNGSKEKEHDNEREVSSAAATASNAQVSTATRSAMMQATSGANSLPNGVDGHLVATAIAAGAANKLTGSAMGLTNGAGGETAINSGGAAAADNGGQQNRGAAASNVEDRSAVGSEVSGVTVRSGAQAQRPQAFEPVHASILQPASPPSYAFLCRICHVESGNEIYVQTTTHRRQLAAFSQRFVELYAATPPLTNAGVGVLVLAPYFCAEMICRAKILKGGFAHERGTKVPIEFVDYGNRTYIAVSQLRLLPMHYAFTPSVFKCKIRGFDALMGQSEDPKLEADEFAAWALHGQAGAQIIVTTTRNDSDAAPSASGGRANAVEADVVLCEPNMPLLEAFVSARIRDEQGNANNGE